MTGILLLREKIEHVLNISNAVDVAVYVNIAVIGGNDTRGFGFLHPDARIVGNLAYLFVINPLGESAVGEILKIHRHTGLHVYECPRGISIAVSRIVGTENGKTSVGESAIDIANPSINSVFFVYLGHFVHADCHAR